MATQKPAVPSVLDQQQSAPVVFDPKKLKAGRRLVLPSISIKDMAEGDVVYLEILSRIRSSEQVDETTGEIKMSKGKPQLINVCTAKRLDTGLIGQIVCPAIIARSYIDFEKEHGEGSYVGLKFAWRKGKENKGKATMWEVVEVIES